MIESLLATLLLAAEPPPPSPEVIAQELAKAEAQFREAKKMFNPWYAGPLITPPAQIVSPGQFNFQPYLYLTTNYAAFDKHGHSHKTPKFRTVNPAGVLLIGMTDWMEGVLIFQGVHNAFEKHSYTNWGDTSFGLAFPLVIEGAYRPAVLIQITEQFPTGKYQHLNPSKKGTDAIGAGSYETRFSFNVAKVVWWWLLLHPMSFRLSLNYTVPAPVTVHGFNSYGGSKHTHGTIRPGQGFQADVGYEFSFTQRWVFALDFVYNYQAKTTFSGRHGNASPGVPAPVGRPFNDQISLAPAIEYNPNENFGILGGVWFTVWGRNAANFISGIVSLEYTF